MKTFMRSMLLAAFVGAGWNIMADVTRVAENGSVINIDEIIPSGEPGVVVLHLPWDNESSNLLASIESWAQKFPNLSITFVDVGSLGSEVCRQFDVREVPVVLVFEKNHTLLDDSIDNVEDLETLMTEKRLL